MVPETQLAQIWRSKPKGGLPSNTAALLPRHPVSKGKRPVKLRSIKSTDLLTITITAVGLYLRTGRTPAQAATATGLLLKAHGSPTPGEQHEEKMLTRQETTNP